MPILPKTEILRNWLFQVKKASFQERLFFPLKPHRGTTRLPISSTEYILHRPHRHREIHLLPESRIFGYLRHLRSLRLITLVRIPRAIDSILTGSCWQSAPLRKRTALVKGSIYQHLPPFTRCVHSIQKIKNPERRGLEHLLNLRLSRNEKHPSLARSSFP